MNNKELGTEFEQEMCGWLAGMGWWVHFISPDRRGAQPFDIIAVKDNVPVAIDCKTSSRRSFPYSRLEPNQITSFEKWLSLGNRTALVMVKYNDHVYQISYAELKRFGKVDLSKRRYLY